MVDISISRLAPQQQQQQQGGNTPGSGGNSTAPNALVTPAGTGVVAQQLNPPGSSVNASSDTDATNVGEDDASRRGRELDSEQARRIASAREGVAELQARLQASVVLDFENAAGQEASGPRALLDISSLEEVDGVASRVPSDELLNFLEQQFNAASTLGSTAARVVVES